MVESQNMAEKGKKKYLLGISAFYHDSAAALLRNGVIVAAAQEERFTRKKNAEDFPVHAIRYCLEEAGICLDELDAVVFYDKPFLKFERLLETYYAFSPKGLFSFLKAMPVWLNEKLFLKRLIRRGLKEVGDYERSGLRLLFTEHHLAHAASAFYVSPFENAAILTIDGVGEWCTASIGIGRKGQVELLREMHFPHSVGLLYSAFTYYLGFKVNSGEYKLMGLAPFGNAFSERTRDFEQKIRTHIVDVKEDGSVWLDQSYFSYATGLRMVNEKKWEQLFGFPRRNEKDGIENSHCDLALAIQRVTEDIVLKMAKEARSITGMDHLCLAGGVALNCVANGRLLRENVFRELFIQPASGDAGGALGAALAAHHMYFGEDRHVQPEGDNMQGSYLGPVFYDCDIDRLNKRVKAVCHKYENDEKLYEDVAKGIKSGMVTGWFQGRMEFGPRALGNRSILADPANREMQKKLNLKIKKREGFRPFAPAVIKEDCTDFFDLDTASPYMLLVAPVAGKLRSQIPAGFDGWKMWDKLYYDRSKLSCITHVDFSARVQTVDGKHNPRFRRLLETFKSVSGYGVLVNTSFNVRGEPVVCTPEDAFRCFMSTDMDCLVMNNYVYLKSEQINDPEKFQWERTFEND
jgi:carbamoyltransferase